MPNVEYDYVNVLIYVRLLHHPRFLTRDHLKNGEYQTVDSSFYLRRWSKEIQLPHGKVILSFILKGHMDLPMMAFTVSTQGFLVEPIEIKKFITECLKQVQITEVYLDAKMAVSYTKPGFLPHFRNTMVFKLWTCTDMLSFENYLLRVSCESYNLICNLPVIGKPLFERAVYDTYSSTVAYKMCPCFDWYNCNQPHLQEGNGKLCTLPNETENTFTWPIPPRR